MKEHFRLPLEHVDAWLENHGFTWKQLESGANVWPTKTSGGQGLSPLSPDLIEYEIGREDPALWAWLNLVAPMNIPGFCKSGDSLALLQIQQILARLEGNVIAECAAEVGKTQDIGVRLLHAMDTGSPGDSCLLVCNTEKTEKSIWRYVTEELEANKAIGGGTKKIDRKDFAIDFKMGTRFESRLVGADGEALRSAHVNKIVFADEVAKYKKPLIWSELWRCAMPGAVFRLYTTPDGDYSSPYFALSARAEAINDQSTIDLAEIEEAVAAPPDEFAELRFKKIWIPKKFLGEPFYSEKRKVAWRQQYGPEHSVGWLNNVEGLWGTPAASVFPLHVLEPMLSNDLPYRLVTASIDRELETVRIAAAELSTEDPGERILVERSEPYPTADRGVNLGALVASFYPSEAQKWVDPLLYCGADLGSSQDPSEYLFVRVVGDLWQDVFRLHLESASYPEQANMVARLDHASGHRVKYAFDAGNAGSSLVQQITEYGVFDKCPVCEKAIHLEERIRAFGFGNSTDDVDLRTGRPILNPDDRDASGNMKPFRLSNKEFSTRVLERKLSVGELRLANDKGAGDPRLAGASLMTNHTARGEKSQKGERRFKEQDDHLVDARRQVALMIASAMRNDRGFVNPSEELVATLGPREPAGFEMGVANESLDDMFPDAGARDEVFSGGGW